MSPRPHVIEILAKYAALGIVVLFFGNATIITGMSSSTWLLILGVLAAPSVVWSMRTGVSVTPIVLWIYMFLLINTFGLLRNVSAPEAFDTFREGLLFSAVLMLTYLLVRSENSRAAAIKVILFTTLFGVANNIYEFFNPGTFSVALGRSAGFYQNPNTSALVLVLGMTIANTSIDRRYRPVFQLVVGLGVLLTFSRGGIVCWAVAIVLIYLVSKSAVYPSGKSWMFAIMILTAVWYSPIWEPFQDRMVGEKANSEPLIQRVANITSVETLEDPRTEIAKAALEKIKERPILGHGTGRVLLDFGSATPQGAHNTYLSLWIQYGLIGLLALPALAAALVASTSPRKAAIPVAVVLLCGGMFSHMLLVQWQYAVAIAIAVGVTSDSRSQVNVELPMELPRSPANGYTARSSGLCM